MYKLVQRNQMKDEKVAHAVDALSETSTTCSSDDEVQALETLLWVSELKSEEESTRQFTVSIGRSCTQQRFGLTFSAKEDGRIFIAEDAKQLGIFKGDLLLSINGCKDLTHEKCKLILSSALIIDLCLLRIDYDAHRGGRHVHWPIDKQSKWSTIHGMRCIELLAASLPVREGAEDEFTLRVSRASLNQKFGLSFRSVNNDVSGKNLTSEIYCAEDLPHLGLKNDDQILGLNGRRILNFAEFQRCLDACMSIELLVKRKSNVPSKKTSLL